MIELKDKKIVVVGTGISGVAAAKLLAPIAKEVYLYDDNQPDDAKLKARFGGDYPSNMKLRVKEYPQGCDVAVISPGVSIYSDIVKRFEADNMPVIGEIELAYMFEKGTVMAITGTNGKTTTTSLVGAIMKAYNEKTYVVGNIGFPYTAEVMKTSSDSVTVAEISSFQLETVKTFAPKVSAILNITPDHIDRHKSMENYVQAKKDVAKFQTSDDYCVLNADDEWLCDFKPAAKVVYFSSSKKVMVGAYLDGDMIMYNDGKEIRKLMNVHDMNLIGKHNYENVMAAVAMCVCMGVPYDIIIDTVKTFKAVEHRIEYVEEIDGVIYYNDSKGTNPDASIKAIEAMERPTILIAGGYDKHVPFDSFIDSFGDKVKKLVLIGETKEEIKKLAIQKGFTNITECDTFEEAIEVCHDSASSGDAVLLSPACASWDMFEGYEQRGRIFKDKVRGYKG